MYGQTHEKLALYEDPEVQAAIPLAQQFHDVLINSVARPSTATAPNYVEVSELFWLAVHSVLTGEKDANQALQELENNLVELTGLPTL